MTDGVELSQLNLVADENCQQKTPSRNSMNITEILERHGLSRGINDIEILKLVRESGRTVMTRDKGMVLTAIKQETPIVWLKGNKIYLVRGKRLK